MKTKILKINPDQPELALLEEATKIILAHGVIGYPTETVYGLGANALSHSAVAKVFQIKERDQTKPILIIAADLDQVKSLVISFPATAQLLAQKFWPGPLTMVLDAVSTIDEQLLGLGNHIGIRIPGNKICLELLKLCGVPITSTSANISGRRNPINAEEVFENFGDKLDLIIDGGKTRSRIPSTVVSIDQSTITLIREGAIPKSNIEKISGTLIHERKNE